MYENYTDNSNCSVAITCFVITHNVDLVVLQHLSWYCFLQCTYL